MIVQIYVCVLWYSVTARSSIESDLICMKGIKTIRPGNVLVECPCVTCTVHDMMVKQVSEAVC